MSWRVVVRPDAQSDVAEAAEWYEVRQEGLGSEFREAVIQVLDALADNPLVNCRQHSRTNIRWRYPRRFPYRVIYRSDRSGKHCGCRRRSPRGAA
jgi:toxin ParE1/3/4